MIGEYKMINESKEQEWPCGGEDDRLFPPGNFLSQEDLGKTSIMTIKAPNGSKLCIAPGCKQEVASIAIKNFMERNKSA